LVGEKAADLLPEAISQSIYHHHGKANFLVLGSGEGHLEDQLYSMNHQFNGYFNSYIGYSVTIESPDVCRFRLSPDAKPR
jgi:Glycogen synthase